MFLSQEGDEPLKMIYQTDTEHARFNGFENNTVFRRSRRACLIAIIVSDVVVVGVK